MEGRKKNNLKHGIYQYVLASWDDFHDIASNLYGYDDTYMYRGQSWGSLEDNREAEPYNNRKKLNTHLLPSILRDLVELKPTVDEYNDYVAIHLNNFRNAIRGKTNKYELLTNNVNEAWALGQHYGLKTPLLDFTYSPYIAAFFALCNVKPEDSSYCTVYAISQKFIKSTKEFEIYCPETDHNQRLLSQNGLFVRFKTPISIESVLKQSVNADETFVKLAKILIPAQDKDKAMEHLKSMNITFNTLFPDLQGASDHANMLFSKGIRTPSKRSNTKSTRSSRKAPLAIERK